MISKALFLLRHNNDIDHLAPVIYEWSVVHGNDAQVVLTYQRSWLQDYRLNFLRQFPKISIRHLIDFSPVPPHTLPDPDFLSADGGSAVHPEWVKRMFDASFDCGQPGVIVTDWNYTNFVRLCSAEGRMRGFKTLALPHGLQGILNRMYGLNEYDPSIVDLTSHPADAAEFIDYLVYPNDQLATTARPNFPRERIKVMGCPRYTAQWRQILGQITPAVPFSKEGKCKIAMLLRSNSYPIFWEEVARTFTLISKIPGTDLIVQHHPRENDFSNDLVREYPWFQGVECSNVKIVSSREAHTFSLIGWADVVIDLGTSAAFDAVLSYIPVLEMEYLHANISPLTTQLSGCEMRCRDDLVAALVKFVENPKRTFYDEQERRELLNTYAPDDGNVLGAYYNLLQRCCADNSLEGFSSPPLVDTTPRAFL